MNRVRTAAVALAAAGILTATAACSSAAKAPTATATATTATTAAALSATLPGVQARWLLGTPTHLPIPASAVTAHFDQAFLAKIPAAQLNDTLGQFTSLRLDAVALSTSEFVILNVTANGQPETVTLSVDARGLIDGLRLAAAPTQAAVAAATVWMTPRDIGSLEWFASPADICKVCASLSALAREPGLATVASILEINDGGLGLDPRHWQPAWFKGSSEPGVVT
jgi:hypothetical protein